MPVPATAGRSGFGRQPLSYDSGAGNGPFGTGWTLMQPSITRKTDKGLPRYDDDAESDTFLLSGSEDLVPVLIADGGGFRRDVGERTLPDGSVYQVCRYRPRIEGLFARIERWTHRGTGATHWRTITRTNVTTMFGADEGSRITDPSDPRRVYTWLVAESWDDKGNAIRYDYRPDDSAGIDPTRPEERNRTPASRAAVRYAKRVRYGNRTPRAAGRGPDGAHRLDVRGRLRLRRPRPGRTRPRPVATVAGAPGPVLDVPRRLRDAHVPALPPGPGVPPLPHRGRRRELSGSLDRSRLRRASVPHAAYLGAAARLRPGRRRLPQRRVPPVEFDYSQPVIDQTARSADPDDVENAPFGVDGRVYVWRMWTARD